MGVKMKLSKIEGVFFSLPAPFYEVTLFLYLLRPRRTGGKNYVFAGLKMCIGCSLKTCSTP